MERMIFVNLPVADLERSVGFYQAIGATLNPQFTDDTAACMVFSETIHVMLLTHDKYRQFTNKEIADTRRTSAALLCLSAEGRGKVDEMIAAALGAGGTEPRPKQDMGFMYHGCFDDPDGHGWEVMWMDMSGFEAAQQSQPAQPQTA